MLPFQDENHIYIVIAFSIFFPTVLVRNLIKVQIIILNVCYLKYFRDNAGPSLKECFFASTGDYLCIVRKVQDR